MVGCFGVAEVCAEDMIREFSLEGAFLHPVIMPPCPLDPSIPNVKTLRTIVKAKQKVLCAERLALLKETDDCVLLRLKSLAASRCWAKFKMFYTRCVGIKNEEQILALFLDVDSVRSGASFDLDALFMSTLSLCK